LTFIAKEKWSETLLFESNNHGKAEKFRLATAVRRSPFAWCKSTSGYKNALYMTYKRFKRLRWTTRQWTLTFIMIRVNALVVAKYSHELIIGNMLFERFSQRSANKNADFFTSCKLRNPKCT